MASIRFIPVQPMMFRGSGEFDPLVSGMYGRAESLPLPTPSTVAGALSTLIVLRSGRTPDYKGAPYWLEEYRQVLGEDVRIRGPLLMKEDKLTKGEKFYVYSGADKGKWFDIEKIDLKKVYSAISGEEAGEKSDKDKAEKALPSLRERVGISLEMRENANKVVKTGYLYSASYIAYDPSFAIYVEVKGDLDLPSPYPVKLGGEGRVLKMVKEESSPLMEKLRARVLNADRIALYLATPALLKAGTSKEEIKRKVEKSTGFKVVKAKFRVDVLGAGYHVASGKRKPIYAEVLSGSIFFTDGKIDDFDEFWWRCSFGIGKEIGYGTLLPLPY